jgi:hypothetical protein
LSGPGGPPEPGREEPGPRPWWDRALDPLRHEAAMFRVLIAVVVVAAVVVIAVLGARAVL